MLDAECRELCVKHDIGMEGVLGVECGELCVEAVCGAWHWCGACPGRGVQRTLYVEASGLWSVTCVCRARGVHAGVPGCAVRPRGEPCQHARAGGQGARQPGRPCACPGAALSISGRGSARGRPSAAGGRAGAESERGPAGGGAGGRVQDVLQGERLRSAGLEGGLGRLLGALRCGFPHFPPGSGGAPRGARNGRHSNGPRLGRSGWRSGLLCSIPRQAGLGSSLTRRLLRAL